MDWQYNGEQSANKLLTNSTTFLKQPFHILTLTLLSLLLPLSFLILSRLSCANYIFSLSFPTLIIPPPEPSNYYSSCIFYLFLYATPSLLYLLVSVVTVAAFIHCITGKITIITEFPGPIFCPRLYPAWIFLCTMQVCVGLGIEGSIVAAEVVDGHATFGGVVDEKICLLSRAIFFLGLHETMLHWCRVVVKPVVDDTVFGGAREEKWVERLAIAASFGCLWWWRLRDEVESLAVVAKAKRELAMGLGVADFVGWSLYYLTVTIGMVRVVKGLMWLSMVLLRRREANLCNNCGEDHDCQDNKV
ncbi:hypothetical protein D8674_004750 [Pyrus ussuriensis x Pyrus communis]|uniref:Transmembrane protein n=1 Tax=Pyrus ussuriensis x Pyrus communis TaxID=2448454 RepID=A0A5N5FPW6_9ROSA|nr:hypothetical protein D8674_004750 [Pyrus ussuriensis x Pyrus communis]